MAKLVWQVQGLRIIRVDDRIEVERFDGRDGLGGERWSPVSRNDTGFNAAILGALIALDDRLNPKN